jgi:hypothetical protein
MREGAEPCLAAAPDCGPARCQVGGQPSSEKVDVRRRHGVEGRRPALGTGFSVAFRGVVIAGAQRAWPARRCRLAELSRTLEQAPANRFGRTLGSASLTHLVEPAACRAVLGRIGRTGPRATS